jgi:protein arginine kinase
MAPTSETTCASGAWYNNNGPENDVILSTRVRLARNLANFPFPGNFRGDDSERVQMLVFDAFSHSDDPDSFQAVEIGKLDDTGMKILTERGVIDTPSGTGIVMRSDGYIACTINSIDHVRIAAFTPGLNCDDAFSLCNSVDNTMQKSVQFAASYDFGFLTASLSDAGSGMKISLYVHLPSVSHAGKIDEVSYKLQEKGMSIASLFGSGGIFDASLGAYYQVSTAAAFCGSEVDQLFSLTSAGKYIAETERKLRKEYAEYKPTVIHDIVYRAYAMVKFSRLISFREAVEIISALKWGCDMNLLTGLDDNAFFSMLYRVRDGHLNFLLKNGNFTFEKDIDSDPAQKINRLRALILQEALERGKL